MNDLWIEYDTNELYDDDTVYPPEGIEVAVTDGKSIDFMWLVYSGGPEWCWHNPEDPDGFSDGLPFEPTHWMTEENSIMYRRGEKIDELLSE